MPDAGYLTPLRLDGDVDVLVLVSSARGCDSQAGRRAVGQSPSLAFDQFITRDAQRDVVAGDISDLVRHHITIRGEEAGAVDPHKAVAP